MARISLLFALAFALGLGSLFLSVSSHAIPAAPKIHVNPKTVYELETLPFTRITQFLNRKEKFAPKTVEFKAMFTMCKGYVAYLESLYKLENPIVDVLGIAKAKYVLMNKSIIAAQASIIGKVDKKTSKKLKKISAALAKGFLEVQETIIKISAAHDFKANAKLSFRESAKINTVVVHFRMHLDAFMGIVEKVEEKKIKIVATHVRKLGEEMGRLSVFERFFRKFSNKYGGYMGGKSRGRELTEASGDKLSSLSHAGADIKGFESIYNKFSHYFGGNLGGLNSRRELVEAQFNAAGKMNFVGKDGFRSLNREHNKHMI